MLIRLRSGAAVRRVTLVAERVFSVSCSRRRSGAERVFGEVPSLRKLPHF